jgi:hypothetical protein
LDFPKYIQAYNLPDNKLAHVPGTVLLDDEAAHSEERLVGLKHGTGKDSHIVLSPQPSDDPNDPLNWPMWKKDMIIAILCLGTMLNAGTNVCFCFLHDLQALIGSGAVPECLILRHR